MFSGEGCSLCTDAMQMLDELGIAYRVEKDPLYAQRIPVVTVDGRIVTEGRVSRRAISAALKRRS